MTTVDVACGELAFLDLTFEGLDALPRAGEERRARELHRSPGGGAITAIGVARLGLSAAVVSPLGADADGDLVRSLLAADGVLWAGRRIRRTAVTAVLPAAGERAMATFDHGEQVTAAELAAVEPRAVVVSLPRLALAPNGAAVYATAGDAEARAEAADPAAPLGGARSLIVNEREALVMTGAPDAAAAARSLGERTPCAVVTLGPLGAVAATDGTLVKVSGVAADPVDTTGAGDLFTAAYVWADLLGAPLEERLRWAVLYAALSVRVATAVAGAVSRAELAAAGARHGLTMPGIPMKEGAR
jgi:sugar/nucleoside kinase (ribokinase family)